MVFCVAGRKTRQSFGVSTKGFAGKPSSQAESWPPSTLPLPHILEGFCGHIRARYTHRSYRGTLSRLRGFFGPITPALGIRPPGAKDRSNRRKVGPDRYAGRHVVAQYLEDITPAVIERFIAGRLESGDWKAPKTANSLRQVLHQLFEYAIKHHGFQSRDPRYSNPAKGVDRLPEAAPNIRFLTIDQIFEQLEAVRKDQVLHAAVAVFIYAGLRRSEACWLTREDVDLEKRIIRVEAKISGPEEWQPKTRRNRAVPISERLAAFLRDYGPPGGSSWYLPSPKGKRWDPDNLSKRLRCLNREACLPWTCLDFRHTFGSQLAQKGLSLYKISALMGNSPGICRRHYAALVPEAMHEEVEFQEPAAGNGEESKTNALLQEVLERLEALGMARPVHRCIGSIRGSNRAPGSHARTPRREEPQKDRALARSWGKSRPERTAATKG